MIRYRNFRLRLLNTPQYRHMKLLIYWPFYGFLFYLLERGLPLIGITPNYYPVEMQLDAAIPFCEFFIVPYHLWFFCLVGIHIYTLYHDIPSFRKLMYFIMITYSLTILTYIFFPTQQLLRPDPAEFERQNIFTYFVEHLYVFDTNTNVCPSLHVIGSMATLFTAWNSKHFATVFWRITLTILAVFICASTVFLKQHSILDIYIAFGYCAFAYPFAYLLPDYLKKKGLSLPKGAVPAAAQGGKNSGEV